MEYRLLVTGGVFALTFLLFIIALFYPEDAADKFWEGVYKRMKQNGQKNHSA